MAMAAPWGTTTGRGAFMSTVEVDRLRLVQWLSPAFPVGSFAHSQGLETAIGTGVVHDAISLCDWIEGVLLFGAARTDAIFLLAARRKDADLPALADLFHAYLPCPGRAVEAAELGRAFAAQMAAIDGVEASSLPYPLAVGRATGGLAVTDAEVLALWMQSLVAQLVSVAVRFMPLGQTAGQKLIAGLAPLIARTAEDCAGLTLDDLGTCTIGADLAGMAQEWLDVRIFRS